MYVYVYRYGDFVELHVSFIHTYQGVSTVTLLHNSANVGVVTCTQCTLLTTKGWHACYDFRILADITQHNVKLHARS